MLRKHIDYNDCPPTLREIHAVGRTTREWMVNRQMSPALAECGIFLCGWSVAREGFAFIRPRFPMSQLLICSAGCGEVWLDGEWHECGPGMAYLNPPHVFHAYRSRTEPHGVEPWTVYWATCTRPLIEGFKPVLLAADPKPFSDAVGHLYAEAVSVRDPHSLTRWTQVVDVCARRITQTSPGDPRLYRLWKEVMELPDFPWDFANLAQRAGVSPEHLRRLCQTEFGCSPMEYVTHLRMQYAVSLLISRRYTVAEVAERVGYATPFSFSTAFKRVLGVPPSRYLSAR